MDRDRVVLAEIVKPRGNRGEVLARSQTDVPGRLQSLKQVRARLADGSDIAVELEDAWLHKNDWILKLVGVNSISEAEPFRGADLWVSAAERAKLPEGEWFRSDLTDCTVVDQSSGKVLGKVEGWQQYGGPLLMQVGMGGREVLIPFVPSICKVRLEERIIAVTAPEGLLDL